jgi:hypothetical protein
MSLRRLQVCWVLFLVSIAGPSHAGPICSGFWDCLPLTLIGLLPIVVVIVVVLLFVALLVFALREGLSERWKRQGVDSAGRRLRLACITAGILLLPVAWYWVTTANNARKHLDRISFSKLLPNPHPSGFDRIQGYAYWNQYSLDFQTMSSGKLSRLLMKFSDSTASPELESCWSERGCDFIGTTPRGRKIYSTRKRLGGSSPDNKAREYYIDVEGTLAVLRWTHSRVSIEGGDVSPHHEFALDELEALVDSLGIATSFDLMRFPGMQVMGSGGGTLRLPFKGVIERSGSDIRIIVPSKNRACIERLEDGSVRVVGDRPGEQRGELFPCEPSRDSSETGPMPHATR